MRNLLNPKWIFLVNTLPIVILFLIFIGEFNIIKSLLDDGNLGVWESFAWTLGILSSVNFGYAVYLVIKKQQVSVWYGAIALLCYIPYVYLYGYNYDQIVPVTIPRWMVPETLFFYVGTFLMPTLAYALFILVTYFTPDSKEHSAWKNFLVAISIPLAWYIFIQIVLPLWKPVENNFGIHTTIIIVIAATLVFLFFLIRGCFIIATRKAEVWRRYEFAWKIPVAILFPLVGLAVNNGLLFNEFGSVNSGIFGDFNSPWFYVLAVVNGIFVCLRFEGNKLYRLLLFTARSVTFAYTFYFFLVFLPFLPLSIIAIAAFGTGFLMLTPLVLFIVHTNELSKDFSYLRTYFSKRLLWLIGLSGVIVLPLFITSSYLRDRNILNETLDYIYSPDYKKEYLIDRTSVRKTINVVKDHKDGNSTIIFGKRIPYLSTYFNWLVLDNLTLSDAKISTIEQVFFGEAPREQRVDEIRNDKVEITNISNSTRYDKSQDAWLSQVDLEITNKSGNTQFSEYATTLNLPVGCWISDYYLYVGDKKEMGILAEKKSAMWVFSQIRNENKDPGILYYMTGNKVAFRIFPFAKDEVRKTGIEFLHRDPVNLIIDGHKVVLGDTSEIKSDRFENENIVYIPASQKGTLLKIRRKPYLYFIVDGSKGNEKNAEVFIKRIKEISETHKELAVNARVSITNSYVNTIPLKDDWEHRYKSTTFEGGFYLDRAIKKALFDSYKSKSGDYPVIVVVTDTINHAILDKDFSDFRMAFPESKLFYNLTASGTLEPHSLISNPAMPITDSTALDFNPPILAYSARDGSVTFLPDDDEPGIVLKKDIFEITGNDIREKNWETALTMQAKWISQTIHPETSQKEWLELVRNSFISKVMTPVTSYLVVENEAQKAILKRKQQQILSGNKSLDPGEDIQQMSEPGLVIMALLLVLALWVLEKRRARLLSRNPM